MAACPNCGKENVEGAAFCAFCGTPLAEVAQTEERRFLTVMFADLVGFTAESDEADPEDVRARLIPYHGRVRLEIERYGGSVEKLIGDGVMAVFGVPTAHEDDPERAVRVALRIQAAVEEMNEDHAGLDLSVRIGINTGEAVVTTGGQGERIVGDVVNTASRLESIAPPGGVVVGEPTFRATELMIEYEQLDPVEVKGKARPLNVWRAIEPRGRYGIDAAVRAPTPFLGRESEMHLLTETFRRVVDDGSLQLVTIAAAPGVGKSRLVNEFWQWADDQPKIVWWRQGRCLPYGEGITFWALGEIVKGQAGIRESDSPEVAADKLATALEAITEDRQDREWMANQLGPLVGTEGEGGERSEAFTAWRRFLEDLASVQPLIMIVEDLHWADAALVEFLEDLLVWSADSSILVICTARPELYESHPGWGGGQRNSATISLAPLSDEHISRLLAALLEQTVLPAETQQALLERAGGNPLYAEEFVRMLGDRGMLHGRGELDGAQTDIPVPETVQALIGSRLDVLSADEARAIEDASVVGKVFWEGALNAMGGSADVRGALRQLVAREWIRPVRSSVMEGEQEYAFWHALTRDVAYGRIPRAGRAEKHRIMAGWIEATAGDRASDHAELLAHHYMSALKIAQAVDAPDIAELQAQVTRTLVMAGDRAARLDAGRAYDYYQRALGLMPPDEPMRPGVLIKSGEAMGAAGLGSTIEVYEEAAALAKAQGDRLTAGHALRLLHLARWFSSGSGSGTDAIDEAIELLEQEPPSEQLVDAYGTRAANYMIRGMLDEQLEWAERAIALNDELGLPVSGRALSNRGIARYHLGDTEGGLDDLRRTLADAEESSGSIRYMAVSYVNFADHVWIDEGPAAAEKIYRTGIERVEARGGDHSWAKAEMMWTGFDLGIWDEVLARAYGLLEQWEGQSVQYVPWAKSYQARVHVWRGDVTGATALQGEYLPALREIQDPQLLTAGLAISARIELERGDAAAAVGLLDEFFAVTEGKSPMYRGIYLTEAVRLLVRSGELDKAAEWVAGSVAPGWRDEISVATAGAILAEAHGDPERALQGYEAVAADWADYGHVLEEAMAHYGAGRCLAALGRPERAVVAFSAARAILERLGAQPVIDEIEGVADRAAAL